MAILVVIPLATSPGHAAVEPETPGTVWARDAALRIQQRSTPLAARPAPPSLAGPQISARYAALVDARTGRLLYDRQAHEQAYPASTTKVLTALVAYESLPLRGRVQVPPEAEGVEGSSLYLEAGEELTVEDLLYGLMLHSGNDAAQALAVAVAGDTGAFAARMNRRAQQAGARSTHFSNPHGLPADDHVTTAYDMALIAADALGYGPLARIVASPRQNIAWPQRPYDRLLLNNNRLLSRFAGADGVKTGYTRAAGRCIVASATRDGHQLIAVLFDAPQMWRDAEALLAFGFEAYEFQRVARAGSPATIEPPPTVIGGTGLPVQGVIEDDLVVPLAPGERQELGAWVRDGADALHPPLPEGVSVARLTLTLAGRPLAPRTHGTVALAEPLARHPWLRFVDRWLDFMQRLITHPAQLTWLRASAAQAVTW